MDRNLTVDPFKGNARKIEMSRYIDLELYHRVERTHPFYKEMIEEISDQIRKIPRDGGILKVMEIGAGTGLSTAELLKNEHVRVDAVELDEECCQIHRTHIGDERCNCICDDAVTFLGENAYDVVVSVFAHDHIPYDRRFEFARNIKNNLKSGGLYIMGGEVLPYFEKEEERKKSLYAYHCYIVEKALRDKNFEVAQIEINALKSGLELTGDFKRHETMFEDEIVSADLTLLEKKKIGPVDVENVGGVFVYVYNN